MTEAEAGRVAGDELRRLVSDMVPSWRDGQIDDTTRIGAGGLGLDSIAMVELLVACEERFGTKFPDSLLETAPLTVGTLVRHLEDSRRVAAGEAEAGPPGRSGR